MSFYRGPQIVTDGLQMYWDIANNKSFKGEPTINLTPNLGIYSMQGWLTLTYIGLEDGWKKYSLGGTSNQGSYPYCMNIDAVLFTGGLTYSTGMFIKTNVPYKFDIGLFRGMNYVNQPMDKGGTNFSIPQPDGSFYVGRYNFQYTSTTNQTGYLWSNPIADGTVFSPATDFVWVKDGQIEQKDHCTPYVNGTRGNTVETGGGVYDISRNNVNGTLVNNILFDSENLGSLKFDGINAYVGQNSSINTGDNFTVSVWMKSPAIGDNQRTLIGNSYNYTGRNGWFLCYGAGGAVNSFFFSIGADAAYRVGENNILTPNNWYYLTATVINGGGDIILYKDDAALTTYVTSKLNTGTTTYTYNQFNIGARNVPTTQAPFTGNISLVQIYNRILTPSEIAKNYNATKSRFK